RARGDPAIPSSQYRRAADIHPSSSLVCAAAVAAAASAECNAWRFVGALCAGAFPRLERPGMAERPLGIQSASLAADGRAWRVVDDRGRASAAVGHLAHRPWTRRPVSDLQPGHRIELAHRTDGSPDPAGAIEPSLFRGQIESRFLAIAAFSGHSGFGGVVRASHLASADDAGDARRDPLWPELAANLLRRRSPGVRQPHGAVRHLGRACDADRTQSRWHRGDDRDRNAAELDQPQAQAAVQYFAAVLTVTSMRAEG